jgi:hypothetical protein
MLSPWAWLAVGALVLSLFGGTYWKGYTSGESHVQGQWNSAKEAQVVANNEAVAKRIAENASVETKHNEVMVLLKKGYENEISTLRTNTVALPRLRINTTTVCSEPTSASQGSGPSTSNADTPTTRLLPESVDSNLRALMQQADEIVAGYRVAQGFIVEQGMAP